MATFSFEIPESLRAWLKRMAEKYSCSESSILRQLILEAKQTKEGRWVLTPKE